MTEVQTCALPISMCDDVAARSADIAAWAEQWLADDAAAAEALRAKARELAA